MAVSDLDLQIIEGTTTGGWTQWRRQDVDGRRPDRISRSAAGQIVFGCRDTSRLRPYRRARLGLARTFQSVELVGDLTLDENQLVAASA